MRQTVRRRMVWGVALAATVVCAPSVVSPPTSPPPIQVDRDWGMVRDGMRFGIPVFGRSELRLLLSKRLKLVLDYRPTAFC